MKWWGWGEEDVFFTHEGKPEPAPSIERVLRLDVHRPGPSAIAFEDLEIPAATRSARLRVDLDDAGGPAQVSIADRDASSWSSPPARTLADGLVWDTRRANV
jgi:hypothetical protein